MRHVLRWYTVCSSDVPRNTAVIHGVVLNEVLQRNVIKVNTITQRGEIWSINPDDIMVSVPGFIPEHILDQISTSGEAMGSTDAIARLQVIKHLDSFEQKITIMTNYYSPIVSKLYDRVRSSDPNQWARLSPDEIMKSNPPPKGQGDRVTSVVALHKLLMLDSLHFVPTDVHRSSLEFSARPLSEVENIMRVTNWIRSNSSEISNFIEKAKAICATSREMAEKDLHGLPSPRDAPLPELTQSDRHIINFLRCAIRKHSAHQTSPYESFAPAIIKKLETYKKDITGDIIFKFLQDIGLLEPWHDMILLTEEKAVSEAGFGSTLANNAPGELADEHHSQRHDWGQLPVYVIDAADAEELDDGISIERLDDGTNWVHVHVADPTSHLSRRSSLATLAATRACTMYGPQRSFPMLPPSFSMSEHSLGVPDGNSGQKVLTFSAHLDAQGSLLDWTVRTGIVHNVHVITYAAVEDAWGEPMNDLYWPFGDKPSSEKKVEALSSELHADLDALRQLGLTQQNKRAGLGRVSWTMPQPRVYFPDKPVPTSSSELQLWTGYPRLAYGVERRGLSPARAMVAEAMILAGKVAGRFCTEKGIPGLFRTIGKPLGAPNDPNMQGDIPAEIAMRSRIASRPAYYSTSPSEHWQLGVDADDGGYVRVTSPLRRFADMVMHWQIKAVLLGEKTPTISLDEMKKYATRLHERESIVSFISKAQQGYWAAVYIQRRLKLHPDEPVFQKLLGYAFAAAEFDTFSRLYTTQVLIPALGIKGWLSTTEKPGWDTGDQVNVRITDVTMVGKAKVRLELAV